MALSRLVPAHCGPFCEAHQLVQDMYIYFIQSLKKENISEKNLMKICTNMYLFIAMKEYKIVVEKLCNQTYRREQIGL